MPRDLSAFVSRRSLGVDASGIRKVFDLAARMTDPINLSIGLPDFDVPAVAKDAAIEAIRRGDNRYTQTQGIAPLRDRLRADLSAEIGRDVGEVLVTSGVSGGLFLAILATLDPGDEAVFLDPYFVMYKHLLAMAGAKPVIVDSYPDFRFHADRVARAITPRTKLLILNSPSNPTGVVMSEAEVRAAVDVARAHDLLILSDEIYEPFLYTADNPAAVAAATPPKPAVVGQIYRVSQPPAPYTVTTRFQAIVVEGDRVTLRGHNVRRDDGSEIPDAKRPPITVGADRLFEPAHPNVQPHRPLYSPAELYERTIVLRGFSKSHAMTGWRLGYAAGPAEVIAQMTKLQQYTFVCAPSAFQHGALAALDVPMGDAVAAYRRKRDIAFDRLSAKFDVVAPSGAFYIFPKAPAGATASEFVARAIENNVLVIPGNVFSERDTHFRISYATTDEKLERGCEILCSLA